MKDHYRIMYLFAAGFFLLITAPALWSEGMFMDGIFYASVAKNIANGCGTFWTPFFSETLYPQFYEHPPLAMGMQSVYFSIFGDSIFVERFYSFFIVAFTGILIVMIWKEITGRIKNAWLPLLLWTSVNVVSWSCSNNMLENTMTFFILLSALFYLKSRKNYTLAFLAASGLSLSTALLTKGFVSLYIWAFPFFFMIFAGDKFLKTAWQTTFLVIITLLPIGLFYFLNDEAANFMLSYFDKQVAGSLAHEQTVSSRFQILYEFLQQIIPILVLIGLSLLAGSIGKKKLTIDKKDSKTALIFLAITFSGILPIMISMKQRGFYITTVYPFFAIAVSLFMINYWTILFSGIRSRKLTRPILRWFSIAIAIAAIIVSLMQINRVGRDRDRLHDIKIIGTIVEKDATMRICTNMFYDWSLHAYFVRYFNIYVSDIPSTRQKYYLSDESCEGFIPEGFVEIELDLKKYKLYKLDITTIFSF